MTFTALGDHDGHSVIMHNLGNDGPDYMIIEKKIDEKSTVRHVTQEEAEAYTKKHNLNSSP